MGELPPQVQNLVAQLQQIQQQLQAVTSQKMQIEAMLKETEEALQEAQNSSNDTPIFKVAGSILVKVNKEKVIQELQEKKETYDIRIKTLQRQEERLKERLTDLQKKIQSMLTPQAG